MGGLEDLILLMIFARAVLAGLVLSLLPLGAFAQGETTNAIVGQVTDATNAAIPGATITITNRETASMTMCFRG